MKRSINEFFYVHSSTMQTSDRLNSNQTLIVDYRHSLNFSLYFTSTLRDCRAFQSINFLSFSRNKLYKFNNSLVSLLQKQFIKTHFLPTSQHFFGSYLHQKSENGNSDKCFSTKQMPFRRLNEIKLFRGVSRSQMKQKKFKSVSFFFFLQGSKNLLYVLRNKMNHGQIRTLS